MQNTQSQKQNAKGVGHVCSNCGQTVECALNTDLYEALKDWLDWFGNAMEGSPPITRSEKAIAKVEGKTKPSPWGPTREEAELGGK